MEVSYTEKEIQELVEEILEECYDRDEQEEAMHDYLQFELDIPFTFTYLGKKWKAEKVDFHLNRLKVVQLINNEENFIEFTDITISNDYTKNIKLQQVYISFLKDLS